MCQLDIGFIGCGTFEEFGVGIEGGAAFAQGQAALLRRACCLIRHGGGFAGTEGAARFGNVCIWCGGEDVFRRRGRVWVEPARLVFRRRCCGTDTCDFVQHFACVADAFGQVGAGVGEGFVEGVEHELVYLLAVAEADFGFGGVDVDVDGFGRQVEEEDEGGGEGVVQYVAVCLFDGVEHDFVAHEAVVDEAELFVGFAFGKGGFGDGAVEPQRAVAAVDF